MLEWALVFLVIALVAGAFGYGGIARSSANVAKLVFFAFVLIAIVLIITSLV